MIVLVNECFSKIYLVSAAILKQNLQKNHLQFSHSTGIKCLFWVWSALSSCHSQRSMQIFEIKD